MTEIEQKAAELREQIKAGEDKVASLTKQVDELKAKLEASETKGESASNEVVELKKSIENIDASIKELKKENEQLKKMEQKGESFWDRLSNLMSSDEFKSEVQAVRNKKQSSTKTFELKADGVVTGNYTGTVNPTINTNQIFSLPVLKNAFLSVFTRVPIPQDKNNIMFLDGTYTSNIGYLDEITGASAADEAALEEKTRKLAKIGAFLPISSESISDFSYFVNWAKTDGINAIMGDLDTKLYSGDGNDSTQDKHIYGLKTQGSTAFSAVTSGFATAVTAPNVADLILAAMTQIKIQSNEKYAATYAFLHPTKVALLRTLKNAQYDYINILPNGSLLVHGVTIIESAKIGVSELFVMSDQTAQLHDKGNIEVEMERIASTDSFKMHMRWRGNAVVPTVAKLGNIYVANITTALTAINIATTTTTAAPTTTTTTAG